MKYIDIEFPIDGQWRSIRQLCAEIRRQHEEIGKLKMKNAELRDEIADLDNNNIKRLAKRL